MKTVEGVFTTLLPYRRRHTTTHNNNIITFLTFIVLQLLACTVATTDSFCTSTTENKSNNNINNNNNDTPQSTTTTNSRTTMASLDLKYKQDGEEAKEIAQYLPYYPFKGIDRFYDIGGFLYEPTIFQKIVDIFADRYSAIGIDVIAGIDARGFILGPPIALALKKPFIMMRKKGKMPNAIESASYQTEYGARSGLTVQKDKIHKGDRVLVIDDLVATGGTLTSAISLVKELDATVVECACIVELKLFINPTVESGLPSRTKTFAQLGHADVPVWGLVSEDLLLNKAELPTGYVDDGEEH